MYFFALSYMSSWEAMATYDRRGQRSGMAELTAGQKHRPCLLERRASGDGLGILHRHTGSAVSSRIHRRAVVDTAYRRRSVPLGKQTNGHNTHVPRGLHGVSET